MRFREREIETETERDRQTDRDRRGAWQCDGTQRYLDQFVTKICGLGTRHVSRRDRPDSSVFDKSPFVGRGFVHAAVHL